MSERGPTMVSDQDIAQALESLLREANPNTTFTSLNQIVQLLESKLGFNLSNKVEFIGTQIQLLLRSQPPPPPFPPQQPLRTPPPNHLLQPHRDHFALHQNPNFQPLPPNFAHHRTEEFGFRPPQPPKVEAFDPDVSTAADAAPAVPAESPKERYLPPNFAHHRTEEFGFRLPQPPAVAKVEAKVEAFDPDVSTAADAAPAVPAESPKESGQTGKKRRGGPGGLNKVCGVTPQLQVIVGQPKLPRTEIVKQLWAYIRKNNLQDPSNKRKIICNDELRLVFETDCTDMFKMNKLLAKHIITLEPTKQVGQTSKKLKVEVESGAGSTGNDTVVIMSEALANFFGTGEREMLYSEVLRGVWEYIKVNQLEDPTNSMMIRCDAKLQELFGCQSIAALGISDMLARSHLFKRS